MKLIVFAIVNLIFVKFFTLACLFFPVIENLLRYDSG